ncbi:methyltransferase domain-containing protein [Fluviicola sp.]|uniref:methyltransferase domain-containing protein n=1 Tax=Fluviicola sp. TaxID=1917219 RepID=UPI00260307AB|nr:methyltransferase domain-containing protein [Fluviicola sp.]
MEKFRQLVKIKEIYSKGENIITYLKSISGNKQNTVEDILISYDFQSGSYIKGFSQNPEFKKNYCASLTNVIERLGTFDSIMEAGVGEGTTLNFVVGNLTKKTSHVLGFDISWSRLKFAKEFLNEFNLQETNLFTANLFEIPLPDNSVDIVYTSHSLEPNGGNEKEALQELYRVTGKYLVLLEPAYEFADEPAKKRMNEHGYVTGLHATAVELGYKIIEHRLFDYSINPLNPTGIIVIEKNAENAGEIDLRCPISLTKLIKYSDSLLYSKESFLAYPVIDGIPCLLKENSILATHLLTDYDEYKKENEIHTKS